MFTFAIDSSTKKSAVPKSRSCAGAPHTYDPSRR